MRGAIPPILHTSPLRGALKAQGQLHLYMVNVSTIRPTMQGNLITGEATTYRLIL